MKKMPEFLLKTILQIALEQKTINPEDHKWWLEKKLLPGFRYWDTDKKYGETEAERTLFWSRVVIDHNYELFMEKFPETQKVEVNNEIFMI